ncbi:concanavalin A-like lectin/glucanase [Trichoderma citrinoviride]|uniref:Concanavalin A-like lectin/glucanase n=1 Tax=Trichoderma citrinoviride TaxID=58853 RepID=A0A2T4AYZ8_9HYPO|nr:concanavalin A-like lectin/glucanase [Trichoderma citrinoviride]PTB62293.1 concanavalin A-like lectin/glucanase [Trichoderma citrinoviride]
MKISAVTYSLLASHVYATPSMFKQDIIHGPISHFSRSNHHNCSEEEYHAGRVNYSTVWSGAVIHSPPENELFNSVSASFVIPKPSIPTGSPNEDFYTVAVWVGIDGDTSQNAILQTGVDLTIANGQVYYEPWYEWWPDHSSTFPEHLSISPGDVVKATVSATSSTSGFAILENVSTGQLVSKYLTSAHALGQQNAEWIVENYIMGPASSGHLTPLANWSSIVFTDTRASTQKSWLDASNATVVNMSQHRRLITEVTIDGSSVIDTYIAGRASDLESDHSG